MIKIEEIAASKGYRVNDGVVFSSRKQLKPSPCSKGYLRFNVNAGSKWLTCWVHRLVAFQKFGQLLYQNKPDVRHMDGNPLNNSDGNIELGTRSQNLRDTPEIERKARAKRMNITKHAALWARIDTYLAQGKSTKETASLVGCSISAVYRRSKIKLI